jgi:hypothetical protein
LSHVADAYLAAGYEVTVVDDLSSGRPENVPDGARFVHADVRSAEARELLATSEFTILNHHAALVDVRYSVANPVARPTSSTPPRRSEKSAGALWILARWRGRSAGDRRRPWSKGLAQLCAGSSRIRGLLVFGRH